MNDKELQNQCEFIENKTSQFSEYFTRKFRYISIIYRISLIISIICISLIVITFLIPDSLVIWIIILFLVIIISFIISHKMIPFYEIYSSSLEILKKYQHANELIKNKKNELNDERKQLRTKFIINKFLDEMTKFQEFYNIIIPLERRKFLDSFNRDLRINIKKYLRELSISLQIPEIILKLAYNSYLNILDNQVWTNIKKSDRNLSVLLKFLRNSKKLVPESQEFQDETLVKIAKSLSVFYIEEFNKNINYLARYNRVVFNFHSFLTDQSIDFNDKFEIWDDLIIMHKDYIPYKHDFVEYLWEMLISGFIINLDLEINQDLLVLLVNEFLIQTYPENKNLFLRKISHYTSSASILYYFYSERSSNDKIGDFFRDNLDKTKDFVKNSVNDKLYQIYLHELQNGNFITEETILLSKFVQRKINEDDYKEISQIIFNPNNPIDLSKALKEYFALKIKDITFLKSLGLVPKIKPFLLSFYTGKGKGPMSVYINKLLKSEKFNLEMKYNAAQYTTSSRIGVLSEQFDSMEEFRLQLENDLTDIVIHDKQREELEREYEEIDFFLKICSESKKYSKKLKEDFDMMLNLEYDKNEFMDQMWSIINLLSSEDREKIKMGINDLQRNLKNYPPVFQIIIHELTYNPKSIQMFGNMEKIAPFNLLKILFAEMIEQPEKLVALLEYNSDKISLQELNEKFIKSLTIQDIINSNSEMKKIHLDKKIMNNLDYEGTQLIIKNINEKCNNLLELSLSLSSELGLAKNNKMSIDEYLVFVEAELPKHKDLFEVIKNAFKRILKDLLEDSKEFKEIITEFIRSMVYISMVVYNRIIRIPEISSLKPLSSDRYEEILQICYSLSEFMESHVKSFSHSEEPEIRDYLLGYLDTHYKGRAGGETFNKEGKTDIFLKFKDTTKFIAECKIWHGPDYIKDAIEKQLIERYTTWRDIHTAILIFNKDTMPSTVNEKIDPLIQSLPYFEKRLKFKSLVLQNEGVYVYELHRKDDKKIKFKLAVLVFHIPKL